MLNRRDFLLRGGSALVGATTGSSLWSRAWACPATGGPGPYGPLLAADANGLMLPAGFRSRVVARGGELVGATVHTWHSAADGAAVFRRPGGYIYACNSEVNNGGGGVGAIVFDHRGRILDAYSICSGTNRNCGGGAMPWGTWLTCEEVSQGRVYECDPTGVLAPVVLPALGTFMHEAACADLAERRLYLTEDRSDGNFYRFTPAVWGQLGSGALEVATVSGSSVSWSALPDPTAALTPTRYQVVGATDFNGGEGIVYFNQHVFFTTKGDNIVWDYDPFTQTIAVLYDDDLDPSNQISGVDNVAASRAGDVIIAEDGGNMELVLITPGCEAAPVVRVIGQNHSELTGPDFDPTGRRLLFNSQRGGASNKGITYEITGPFRRV